MKKLVNLKEVVSEILSDDPSLEVYLYDDSSEEVPSEIMSRVKEFYGSNDYEGVLANRILAKHSSRLEVLEAAEVKSFEELDVPFVSSLLIVLLKEGHDEIPNLEKAISKLSEEGRKTNIMVVVVND